MAAPAIIGRTPLIGRGQELTAVLERLARARTGNGSAVLLAGEAGIGKSRLVAEVKARAVAQGFLVLQGTCFETDRTLPFAPFTDLLRGLLAPRTADEQAELLGPAAGELLALLPELAFRLPGLTPAPAVDEDQDKRRLLHSLAELVFRLATPQPLLIVLEDLHWSDDTSLEFLLFLARRLAAQPILLLLTCRSDESSPGLEHLLAELDRERLVLDVPLARLAAGEVDAMIRAIFEQERAVRADFLDTIYELTDGNPFFIEEVLKSLVAAGDIFYHDGRWDRRPVNELRIPRTVQDAVRRRVKQLSDGARETLVLAAVAGQRFDFALLERLTGLHERALLDHIKELIAAQLVVEESADHFAFRHALTREAVAAGLLARERRMLHGRIAAAIEGEYGAVLDMHLADLAYHCFEAEDWAKTLEYARRAGERAQAMHTPRAAMEQFTRALAAARALGVMPPPFLFRARGQAYEILGEFERARADHEAALAAARPAGDREAEWQALLDLGFLWAARDYDRTGAYFRQALALARELEEPALIARSLNRTGNWYLNAGLPQDAVRYHDEALATFEGLGDRRGIAETLDLLGMAASHTGDLARALACYERALMLCRELDDRRALVSVLAMLGQLGSDHITSPAALPVADPTLAVRHVEEAVAITRGMGWRSGEAYALEALAFCLTARGDYTRALETARTCLAIAEEIEHHQWTIAGHVNLGAVYLDLLALAAARRHFERALALAQEVRSGYWTSVAAAALAWTCLEQGDAAQAERHLDLLPEPPTAAHSPVNWFGLRVRAELALAGGDAEGALAMAGPLITWFDRLPAEMVSTALWLLRGKVLTALGRSAEAEDVLRTALVTAEQRHARPLIWRIHMAIGRYYQSGARPHDAEREFAAARGTIEELAMNVPDDPDAEIDGGSLRAHFSRAALAQLPRPRQLTPLKAAKQAYGGLTAREREVAALIAQGCSNREVAEALVIGERTVQTHVENIFAKLGFSSRTQIAAWAVERGLHHG